MEIVASHTSPYDLKASPVIGSILSFTVLDIRFTSLTSMKANFGGHNGPIPTFTHVRTLVELGSRQLPPCFFAYAHEVFQKVAYQMGVRLPRFRTP